MHIKMRGGVRGEVSFFFRHEGRTMRKWITNMNLCIYFWKMAKGRLRFMAHYLALRLDLIKKAVASLSSISSFHRASVPDSLCEARPLVEAWARRGNDRGEAKWTYASCWRWHSWIPFGLVTCSGGCLVEARQQMSPRRGLLAVSQRPAGLREAWVR